MGELGVVVVAKTGSWWPKQVGGPNVQLVVKKGGRGGQNRQ